MWIVKRLSNTIVSLLERAILDPEITGFFKSMASLVLKFVVILIAAETLGFEVSSILRILVGVVFAIGLALQGFLGNFAVGISIVLFKLYRVGDWVQVSDTFDKVDRIEIFNIILITPGEKILIIPNGQATVNIITNFSTQGRMRLELQVTMPYEESFPRIKRLLRKH